MDTATEDFTQIVKELSTLDYIPGVQVQRPNPYKTRLKSIIGIEPNPVEWSCFLFEQSSGQSSLQISTEAAAKKVQDIGDDVGGLEVTVSQKNGRSGLKITSTVPIERNARITKARAIGDMLSEITPNSTGENACYR